MIQIISQQCIREYILRASDVGCMHGKLDLAMKKDRHLRRCINSGSLLLPDLSRGGFVNVHISITSVFNSIPKKLITVVGLIDFSGSTGVAVASPDLSLW